MLIFQRCFPVDSFWVMACIQHRVKTLCCYRFHKAVLKHCTPSTTQPSWMFEQHLDHLHWVVSTKQHDNNQKHKAHNKLTTKQFDSLGIAVNQTVLMLNSNKNVMFGQRASLHLNPCAGKFKC